MCAAMVGRAHFVFISMGERSFNGVRVPFARLIEQR
jgi:hypothetical protein